MSKIIIIIGGDNPRNTKKVEELAAGKKVAYQRLDEEFKRINFAGGLDYYVLDEYTALNNPAAVDVLRMLSNFNIVKTITGEKPFPTTIVTAKMNISDLPRELQGPNFEIIDLNQLN